MKSKLKKEWPTQLRNSAPLEIMYSNAGIAGPVGSILDLDMARFDRTIATNLSGSVMAVKHAARVMVANIPGSIICTTSSASTIGGSGPHASELGKHGIGVNCTKS